MKQDDSLLEMLVEVKPKRVVVSPEELQDLNDRAQANDLGVIDQMIHEGLLTDVDVAKAKAKHFDVEFFDLVSIPIPNETIALVDEDIAHRFNAIPVATMDNRILVAVADPSNLDNIDGLAHALNTAIEIMVATEKAIIGALDRYYPTRITSTREV